MRNNEKAFFYKKFNKQTKKCRTTVVNWVFEGTEKGLKYLSAPIKDTDHMKLPCMFTCFTAGVSHTKENRFSGRLERVSSLPSYLNVPLIKISRSREAERR